MSRCACPILPCRRYIKEGGRHGAHSVSIVGFCLVGLYADRFGGGLRVRDALDGIERQAAPASAGWTKEPIELKMTRPPPWQLTPPSLWPRSRCQAIIPARVPGLGVTVGTRTAIAYVAAHLLVRVSVRTRVLEPCRRLVSAKARRLGATRVDAASQGPDRRKRDGGIKGRAGLRSAHARGTGYGIRQAVVYRRANVRGPIVATHMLP